MFEEVLSFDTEGLASTQLKYFMADLTNVRAKLAVINKQMADRKASRSTIFIRDLKDEPKQAVQLRGKGSLVCKAVTLSGAPCKSRANCGAYCKRHYFVSKE